MTVQPGLAGIAPFDFLPQSAPAPTSSIPSVLVDGFSTDTPTYRQFLEALGVAVYTTDADGKITFFNEAAAKFWGRRPEIGELWCGSLRMFWPDGRPLPHDQCPMAIALRERRSVRGYQAVAERPDGSRAAFIPYPTVLHDANGNLVGAVNVIIDITEQRRAEWAANAASAAKDEFLGLVSHELRTPVTTIFGNARLLADRHDLTGQVAAMVADISTDAERLLDVVENLLTLTRAEAHADIEGEPQLLARSLSRIVSSFERRHPGREIKLEIESRDVIVEVDGAHLDLLVGNLLSNAHKYSQPNEAIEVILRRENDEAQVVVLDRGIGFAEDEADALFTTFHRTEAARKIASGLGIGLSACRRIVELLGGRIWARPREGGGAELGFALPIEAEARD